MNKKEKELEWEKFFDMYNIKYTYTKRKQVKIKGKCYYANPSFYLLEYGVYFHVGNASDDSNVSKDQFIYDNAVRRHLYKDLFITNDTPELYKENIYALRKQVYIMCVVDKGELVFAIKE